FPQFSQTGQILLNTIFNFIITEFMLSRPSHTIIVSLRFPSFLARSLVHHSLCSLFDRGPLPPLPATEHIPGLRSAGAPPTPVGLRARFALVLTRSLPTSPHD